MPGSVLPSEVSNHSLRFHSPSKQNLCASVKYQECLVLDRSLAGKYLKQIAGEFPQLTENLQILANLYREESELLKPTEEIIMYGFNMKNRDAWSPNMRKEAVTRLERAKAREETALEIWKQIAELTAESKK